MSAAMSGAFRKWRRRSPAWPRPGQGTGPVPRLGLAEPVAMLPVQPRGLRGVVGSRWMVPAHEPYLAEIAERGGFPDRVAELAVQLQILPLAGLSGQVVAGLQLDGAQMVERVARPWRFPMSPYRARARVTLSAAAAKSLVISGLRPGC